MATVTTGGLARSCIHQAIVVVYNKQRQSTEVGRGN